MKRSMAVGRGEEEGSRKICLNDESRKFQKVDLTCNVTNPGKMEFVANQKVEAESESSSCAPQSSSLQRNAVANDSEPSSSTAANSSGLQVENNVAVQEATEVEATTVNNSSTSAETTKVTLVTDDGSLTVERNVLVDHSDYFRAMFTVDMVEKTKTSIYLKDISAASLQRYLNFIQCGSINIDSCKDALQLLQFSVYLQCSGLTEFCSLYLTSHLSAENACIVLSLTQELALNKLENLVLDYIFDHFTDLNQQDIAVETLRATDIIKFLESDCLARECKRCCELLVLRIAVRWLLRNPFATDDEQDSIMSNVRFSLIQLENIEVECQKLLAEHQNRDDTTISVGCMKAINKYLRRARMYHQKLYEQPLLQTKTTNVRSNTHTWVSIDGVVAPSAIKLPRECKCDVADHITHIRDPFHSVVELNGFLFVIGGTREIDGGFSNVVIRYDPRLNTFIQLSPMRERRGDFVAFPYHDRIYVFGGRNKHGGLKSCECYDIGSNTWKYIPDLPQSLYMAAGVQAEGKMYLCGGFRDHLAVAETLSFDPATDTWDNRHFYPMTQPRGYHVMTQESDGQLWAVGGIDNSLSGRNVYEVEALDMRSGIWRFVSYVLPVSFLSSTMRLNILRKGDGNICISAVSSPEKYPMLEYNEKSRVWSESKPPLPAMMGVNFPSEFHLA